MATLHGCADRHRSHRSTHTCEISCSGETGKVTDVCVRKDNLVGGVQGVFSAGLAHLFHDGSEENKPAYRAEPGGGTLGGRCSRAGWPGCGQILSAAHTKGLDSKLPDIGLAKNICFPFAFPVIFLVHLESLHDF